MFNALSAKSRTRKLELFFNLLSPGPHDRVLDIGGECDPAGPSVQLSDKYPWKHRLTVANIDLAAMRRVADTYPDSDVLLADACRLPFADKSFDIGFSNAVIEHLYTWKNQQRVAAEIQRVCKRWFLATPNRWFPYEFHARLPLVSWLPAPLMHRVTRVVCYSHALSRYKSGLRTDEIRLLTPSEMRSLFPLGRILPLRITFYPETLLAVGPVSAFPPNQETPLGFRILQTNNRGYVAPAQIHRQSSHPDGLLTFVGANIVTAAQRSLVSFYI